MLDKTKVTVGLICYREREQIASILQSLVEQTVFHQIGEVLLVQNGDCEQTLNSAKIFLKKLPLIILPHPINHIGKARAMIVNQASEPLIAFTDGDCIVPPNWLETLLIHWNHCADLSPSGVGGPNRLPENHLWKKLMNLSVSHFLGHGWSPQAWKPKNRASVSHIPTTNALFSSQKIKQAGNFSKKFHPVGEDLELGFRLKALGPLYLFPEPLVINNYASSYFMNLKRLFRFGQVQWKNKNSLLALSFSFIPGFCFFLALGFYYLLWWLPLAGYFSFLMIAALQVLTNSRSIWALSLPFFWFLQHSSYSLGVISGLLTQKMPKQ
ncbi:MAG: glycosyltransferase [Bdellovibrionales bacterium]|nr:glycosyltransferase [Bdellovibrionales bacterium]